ncbi:hypothetical protein MRX96_057882 [Rhipicephalus microplus]
MFVRATRDYRWAASQLAALLRPLMSRAYDSCPVHGWFLSGPVPSDLHVDSVTTRPAASQAAPRRPRPVTEGRPLACCEICELTQYCRCVYCRRS